MNSAFPLSVMASTRAHYIFLIVFSFLALQFYAKSWIHADNNSELFAYCVFSHSLNGVKREN